jgi:hypothetical protein
MLQVILEKCLCSGEIEFFGHQNLSVNDNLYDDIVFYQTYQRDFYILKFKCFCKEIKFFSLNKKNYRRNI